MRAQRVREAESRIEMQVAKWTAEGEYSVTCGHTSVAGDMLVSYRAHGSVPVNQGGTAEKI